MVGLEGPIDLGKDSEERMNTILFWDAKAKKAHSIKVTQSKRAIWRNPGVHTTASAHKLAKKNGWVHVTSKTKVSQL